MTETATGARAGARKARAGKGLKIERVFTHRRACTPTTR